MIETVIAKEITVIKLKTLIYICFILSVSWRPFKLLIIGKITVEMLFARLGVLAVIFPGRL